MLLAPQRLALLVILPSGQATVPLAPARAFLSPVARQQPRVLKGASQRSLAALAVLVVTSSFVVVLVRMAARANWRFPAATCACQRYLVAAALFQFLLGPVTRMVARSVCAVVRMAMYLLAVQMAQQQGQCQWRPVVPQPGRVAT